MRVIDKDKLDSIGKCGYIIKRYKHFAIMRGYQKGHVLSGLKENSKDASEDIKEGFLTLVSGLWDLIITIFSIFPTIWFESKVKRDNDLGIQEES